MTGQIIWNGQAVPFVAGETLAQALDRAGFSDLGRSRSGSRLAMFCGIGQCQNCLVIVEDMGPREACRTLCKNGMVATSPGGANG
jgi:ferredoxin